MTGFPITQGRSLGYQQLGSWASDVVTAASWSTTGGGQVTFTTTTAHGVAVGQSFQISGMSPSGYDGWFVAIAGTTGSTLVAALATSPGAATVMGSLAASLSAATSINVPPGMRGLIVAPEVEGVRVRDDGVAPTATVGWPVASGSQLEYASDASKLQIIQQTAGAVCNLWFFG